MEVKPGYKQTEVGVIPEDWDVLKLGDMIDYIKGFAFKSSEYQNTGIRVVRVSDTTYDSIKEADPVFVSETKAYLYAKWKLKENDLVISTVGSKPPMYDSMVGKVILIRKSHEGTFLNQNAVLMRDRKRRAHVQWLLLNHLRTKRYLAHIEAIYRGNANQASITLQELFQFEIPLPSDDTEQRAIAGALGDVDALLGALEKLIANKRDLKQATMQQLLTGKTRLPGFAGEWETKQLGDVIAIKKGQLITEKDTVHGNIPVIAGGKKPSYFHNRANRTGKTITISGSGANAGYVAFFETPIFASDCSTISEGASYAIKFIYYFLQLRQEEIYEAQTGGAQPHIHPSDLRPLTVGFPGLSEQTAIAEVLSDMDEEIVMLEERLVKTRALKQGMMQELLTGKTRLI